MHHQIILCVNKKTSRKTQLTNLIDTIRKEKKRKGVRFQDSVSNDI